MAVRGSGRRRRRGAAAQHVPFPEGASIYVATMTVLGMVFGPAAVFILAFPLMLVWFVIAHERSKPRPYHGVRCHRPGQVGTCLVCGKQLD